jgi:hypothetical protein
MAYTAHLATAEESNILRFTLAASTLWHAPGIMFRTLAISRKTDSVQPLRCVGT